MILGIDVSKWQGVMDWQKAALAGAKFAFIRAGSINNVTGECYTDYQFERNAELAPEYMPIGFYWYFRPNHDPLKQADYLCNLMDGKSWVLPAVEDLETSGSLSAAKVTESAAEFALRIYQNLDLLPLLYSRAYWMNRNTVPDDFMKLLDLFIARYTFKGKPWGNILPYPDLPGFKPRDYDTWKFWQFSADGNGRGAEFGAKSKAIDIDYFNGDQVAFDEYIGEEPPPPPKVELPASGFAKLNFEIDGKDVKYQGRVNLVE